LTSPFLTKKEALAYTRLTQNAWNEFVKTGIIASIPGTQIYDARELDKITERVRERNHDNTIQFQNLQSKPEKGPKPIKRKGSTAGWNSERIASSYSNAVAGESK